MVTREQIEGLMETVRNLYLADSIPWVIGYSGGKDSTATLQLVWLALRELPDYQLKKAVHIINTDTLVESPVVAKWAQQSLRKMEEAADAQHLPFVPHRLTPDFNNTFWVNLIGRGYPFPRKKSRWCTDRLKIQPVNKFIKEKLAEHGEIIMVLGTRKAESANRAKTMAYYEKKRVRELLDLGRYMPEFLLAGVNMYERLTLASDLLLTARDLSDEGKERGLLPSFQSLRGAFDDEQKAIVSLMASPESLQTLIDEWRTFDTALKENDDVLRFRRLYPSKRLLCQTLAKPWIPTIPAAKSP